MSSCLSKILELCDRHHFAQAVLNGAKSVEYFKFGSVGELLKNNICQEWMYSSVINSRENVFPYHWSENSITGNLIKDLNEPYDYAKHLSCAQLPFGVAGTRSDVRSAQDDLSDECKYFQPKKHTALWLCLFARPESSTQLFYQMQRQRKMWWRKFAASPGRFSLTDIQNNEDCQLVEIKASFPWGCQTVETIRHVGSSLFVNLDNSVKELFEGQTDRRIIEIRQTSQLYTFFTPFRDALKPLFRNILKWNEMFIKARDGRKKVLPHMVESVTSLDAAVLTFLCDAHNEVQLLGVPREVMLFHRRLAPYKTSFAIAPSNATTGEELTQLAHYLNRQLRQIRIPTLLLPDLAKKSLEAQFIRNDELGIPYTVVLNETSLKSGIFGLRSRDTMLKEQVHVTELKNYMELLLKNY